MVRRAQAADRTCIIMSQMNVMISIVLLMGVLFSSCEKDKSLPGDVPTVRYQTDLVLQSQKLGCNVLYSIYLPEDYNDQTQKRYPVVYLLHGLGNDHKDWNDEYLNISSLVSYMEQAKGLEPMIYVMPQGFRSYYVNRYNGAYPYMDMFAEELVPQIDRTLRTLADRGHRAVIGYSMGGFGAMILPSKHPDLFSVSVPLSMSFRTDAQYMTEPQTGWNTQWGDIFGGKGQSGEARLTDYYKQHCPFYMFTAATAPQYANVKYWYDCGDDEEQLEVANDLLHVRLRETGIPHEYRVRDGAHTSSYWRSGTVAVLPYIQNCFNGAANPDEEGFTPPASHSATHSAATLGGISAQVYLPASYDADESKRFPVIYLMYDAALMSAENAMRTLSPTQTSRPFILVAANASGVQASAIEGFVTAVDAAYRTIAAAKNRTAIGVGMSGGLLYAASLDADFPISSLFMLDAALPAEITARNASVYYYCSLPDMGTNYIGANAFYTFMHGADPDGETFQYRVYNGLATPTSMLYGLEQMRADISSKIKTNQP